jgi:hypothetical protein
MRKPFWAALSAFVTLSSVCTPSFALTATSFSSFEGQEEPAVIYHPSSDSFTSDSFDNMTSPSSGVFRFYLRFSSSAWDGDRTTTNEDRQRAEVRGLGTTHQKNGETWEYAHTWKTSRGGSGAFWHVFQLKAVDGDNAPPLVVDSVKSSTSAAVQYCSGSQSGFTLARSYTIAVGSSITTNVRIHASTSTSGEVRASINGGAMSGKTGIAVYRPSATSYRPKWGSYRGVSTGSPYGNDTVEQKGISSNKK